LAEGAAEPMLSGKLLILTNCTGMCINTHCG